MLGVLLWVALAALPLLAKIANEISALVTVTFTAVKGKQGGT